MKNWLFGIAVFGALLVVGVITWFRETIPVAPDPAALPSQVLASPAADYEDAVEQGRTIARALVAEEILPGLSLAVAIDRKIVWAEGFRWADLEQEIPVTPATRFRIGGIAMTFTAAAAGLLSEQHRLDLDAPVQRYLPTFPEKEWPISARQLMTHTAGLKSHRGDGGLYQGIRCADDAERLAIFADEPLRSRPGTEFHFSNYGWVLVGAVITATANEPYLDFLQREIFAPLGMLDTVPDLDGEIEPGSAHFYYPRFMLNPSYGLQESPTIDLSCYLPAVGFLSTPSDLVRFGSAMMSENLLAASTIEELQAPVRLESGEVLAHALGWIVQSVPLGRMATPTRIVGQGLDEPVVRQPLGATTVGGQVAGSTATLLTVPERRLAVAVASNVSGAENVPLLAVRLADLFVRWLEER